MHDESKTKQQLVERLAAPGRRIAELEGSGAQRKRAEETPRRSEEPYRTLFEGIPVGLYRTTPEGRILDANQTLVQLLGYPDRRSLTQVKVGDLYVDPEDREREVALLQQEGVVHGFEVRLRRYDGSVSWVRHTARIGRESRGHAAYYEGALEDISEQKRAEEALRKSEAKHRSLVEQSHDAIYLLYERKFEFINDRFEELLGVTQEEVQAPHFDFMTLVAPQSRPLIEARMKKMAAGEELSPRYEFTALNADGKAIEVEVSVSYVPYQDGVATQGVLRDVTERKRTEEERQEQLARISLLNKITRAVTARLDRDSIFRVVAQQLEDNFTDLASIWLRDGEAFTLAASGVQGARIATEMGLPDQVGIPSDVPEFRGLLQEELAYVADSAQLDVPALEPVVQRLNVRSFVVAPLVVGGMVFGVLVSARHSRDAFSHGELEFLGGLSEHVSMAVQQAQLYQNLQAAYDDLRQTRRAMMREERLRSLGEMASGIAHDINNAISPIPLHAAMIERETELSDEATKHLRIIETAVKDVGETVGRMSHLYREREEEELLPVDVSQLAQQAVDLTRPHWQDAPQEQGISIDLHTDFQEDLPPVMGNKGGIRQAATNLILNAVDAMPHDGTLAVRTRMRAGAPAQVILEVSDTGTGMDEKTQERCFEPFFSTKGERGSGMGLAMVYGTMQRHGGAVGVDSALGEGTTMRLHFPVREVAEEGRVGEAVAPPSPLRILCIDDEPLLREALKEALEGEGHTVELAAGGRSGLDTFRAARQRGEPFDVVITDLGMPYVDGREVARRVKKETPETPVILLTGWGQRLGADGSRPAGADLVLSKPPTIAALNRALARVTSRD
jgi:PAS domain S-box-containing protein